MASNASGPQRPAPGKFPSVWIGGLCLCAGVLIGRAFPGDGNRHVWSEPTAAAVVSQPAMAAQPTTFRDVVALVRPGVVSVHAQVSAPDFAGETPDGERSSRGVRSGSGFVVNRTGLVVSARHVVVRAARIVVEVPQLGRFDAEVVGEDDVTDIAVLRIASPPRNLPVLELGRSEDLRAGDWIVAVGNPFGFSQTVTAGVVSFVGRHLQNDEVRVSSDFLQFSAPVNPGSSGGPVFDLAGRVVGVTTQAADAAQGISFAIPSRTLKWVLDSMDRSPDGRVHRGHLGIGFDSRSGTDDYGAPLDGAVVHRVVDGEAADQVGVRPGDVVLFFDDHPVAGSGDLYERITRGVPGSAVRLTLLRKDRVLEPVEVVLGDYAMEPDGELVH